MIVVSYDISNDKLRTQFSRFLERSGGIRLQMSVFEINNSKRIRDLIVSKIESHFSKKFDGGDSVFIFFTDENTCVKYGNAIHRDKNIVYFD